MFEIRKDAFYAAVKNATRAVNTKHALPVLRGIRVFATNSGLYLSATNTEMYIRHSIAIDDPEAALQVKKQLDCVVPGHLLLDIVAKFDGQMIKVKRSIGEITISSGRTEFSLSIMDPEDFPAPPSISSAKSFSMKSTTLRHMIRQTEFACLKGEQLRSALTGVCMHMNSNGELRMIASDAHRVSIREESVERVAGELSFENVVPRATLYQLYLLLQDQHLENAIVTMTVDKYSLMCWLDERVFVSLSLIDEKFPVERLLKQLPEKFVTSIQTQTKELFDTVDRASIFAQHENNVIALSATELEGVSISVNTTDIGIYSENLHESTVTGHDIRIGCNVDYVTAALKKADSTELQLGFSGPASLVRMSWPKVPGWRYFFAPARLL